MVLSAASARAGSARRAPWVPPDRARWQTLDDGNGAHSPFTLAPGEARDAVWRILGAWSTGGGGMGGEGPCKATQ